MAKMRNYKGEVIDGIPVFRKKEYDSGKIDKYGRHIPDWSLIEHGDNDGFDVDHVEPNGIYKMEVVLPKHTRLIRYGLEIGSFTAPKGTKFEEVSLPYTKESVCYHEYEVIADSITVTAVKRGCIVDRGRVAPGFDYPGGGIQYKHKYNMIKSINKKLLKEII